MDEKIEVLAELLRETAIAHHEAYSATDGDDPAWPLWYAEHLADRLTPLVGETMDKDALADELARLDEEVKARPEEEDWALYYARSLLKQAT